MGTSVVGLAGKVSVLQPSAEEVRSRPQNRFRLLTAESERQGGFLCALAAGREIIRAAQIEAQQIVQAAKERSRSHYEMLMTQALEQAKTCQSAEILAASKLRRDMLENSSQQLLKMVTDIAEEVISAELTQNPSSIIERIRRALDYAIGVERLTLLLNHADMPLVQERLDSLAAQSQGIDINLCESSAVAPGNARLEFGTCVVDASVEAHFRAIKTHLLNAEERSLLRSSDRSTDR